MSALDDIDFSGDRFLSQETKRQVDDLFEAAVVEIVLKHYSVPKTAAYNWHHVKYGERKATCECLAEVAPDFPHHLTACRLKYDLKRITGLSYASVDKSPLGEAVRAYSADSEPYWVVTDFPLLSGHIVVGKREFPLETSFTGYVLEGPDNQCYLLCPLRSFLESSFCKKPYQ